jgi:type IV secretion system protein VirB3
MEESITQDVLFLACTRPAMWQGVPLPGVMLNFVATMMLFIMVMNPLYMMIGVVVHIAMRTVVATDYNMFGMVFLWFETKLKARNTTLWGGSSISPLPLRPARKAREVRVVV